MTDKSLFALSLGFAAVILLTAGRGLGQEAPACGPHDAVRAALAERYGEVRQGLGLSGNTLIELYAAPDGRTWTLTVTRPDGTTCLIASGSDYEVARDPTRPRGKPA